MILLIDKPAGITSFDAIRILRRKLGVKKMGHAGTLDPLASGLLIVATNDDTKRLTGFLKLPKTYEVTVRVGERRTTADLAGEVEEQTPVPALPEPEVRRVAESLVGVHELPVPKYSAIKVKGRPLYSYARNGEQIDLPVKHMVVHEVAWRAMAHKDEMLRVQLLLSVASGTYVRSIAEEFGRRLGYPAVVEELRRITIGDFHVRDAENIEIR